MPEGILGGNFGGIPEGILGGKFGGIPEGIFDGIPGGMFGGRNIKGGIIMGKGIIGGLPRVSFPASLMFRCFAQYIRQLVSLKP